MAKGAAREEQVQAEVTDVAGEWRRFLVRRYNHQLAELQREFPHSRSLYLDYRTILPNRLADAVLESPGTTIENIRDALVQHKTVDEKDRDRVNIRFTNLPRKTPIRDIRADQMNKYLTVEGILRKTTEVRPRIVEAVLKCTACRQMFPASQSYGKFQEPEFCPKCEKKARFDIVASRSRFTDSQKLRIQESPEGLRGGEQPQTLDVDVIDDLTGKVAPGDRVAINGILRTIQRVTAGVKGTLFDIYLECNSIEVSEKEFEEVSISEEDEKAITALSRDPQLLRKIVRSIAPTIYGNEDVKEAVALQLFGGIPKEMPDGTHLRGDIHMLLVGDPGIAKSQILRYVVTLSPRGIYTSGKSSTAAGLTATAVKDEFGDGRWTLEAGALVLADMGIAAVDEMDKMRTEDRSALHEAMEQQSISVAKAGITATLRCRCALLGAANPKLGRFDAYTPISEQINMPAALLSRFDLIFVMQDQPDPKLDEAIAEHILKTHRVGELIVQHGKKPIPGVDDEFIKQQLSPVTPDIPPALMRKYVAYAKRTCYPILSDEAKDALEAYYLKLRGLADANKPVPVTARQIEALVRLGEASARIRLSDSIGASDAERVIHIVDTCLRQVAYDAESGSFDIDKLVTGVPKSQRDIIRAIKEVIRDLGGESREARMDQLVEIVSGQGFTRDRVEQMIKMLLRDGEALEPRSGIIKLIGY
jgi:replicative DNA helicase Mcm